MTALHQVICLRSYIGNKFPPDIACLHTWAHTAYSFNLILTQIYLCMRLYKVCFYKQIQIQIVFFILRNWERSVLSFSRLLLVWLIKKLKKERTWWENGGIKDPCEMTENIGKRKRKRKSEKQNFLRERQCDRKKIIKKRSPLIKL